MDVYGPAGNIVDEESLTLPTDNFTVTVGIIDGSSNKYTQYLYQKGGDGKYKVVWYLNDKKIGKDDFTITP